MTQKPVLRLRLCRFEILEPRQVLSANALLTAISQLTGVAQPFATRDSSVQPFGELSPVGYVPSQIRAAYGFDKISFPVRNSNGTYSTIAGNDLGKGMTVAIVNAYNNPTIVADVQRFSEEFGLPQFNNSNGPGKPYSPTFKIINQNGKTGPLPVAEPGWAVEIALDVQWVHAIAPAANIVLVLATDNSNANMFTAVNTARKLPGVVAVSNSWGSIEFLGQSALDSVFVTPPGHSGVSFIVAAGDDGGPASYPSASPNVLSIGGTALTLDPIDNSPVDEVVWNNQYGAGGGGESGLLYQNLTSGELLLQTVVQVPNYQRGLGLNARGTPDVSYNGDPLTGVAVFSTYALDGWESIGGTSAGAPQWAALVAIANQGRKLKGKAPLSNVQSIIYKLSDAVFNDITEGDNDFLGFGLGYSGNAATAGYDLASGRGTPKANLVVRDLVAFSGSTFVNTPRTNVNLNSTGNFYFFAKPKYMQAFAGPQGRLSAAGAPPLLGRSETATEVLNTFRQIFVNEQDSEFELSFSSRIPATRAALLELVSGLRKRGSDDAETALQPSTKASATGNPTEPLDCLFAEFEEVALSLGS